VVEHSPELSTPLPSSTANIAIRVPSAASRPQAALLPAVVMSTCAGTSPAAHDAALSRMTQAGAVRMTTVGTVLEFQRDWAHREHYNDLMTLFREHGGAYGIGIEYAYTMVHKAPAARKTLK